MNIIPRRIAVSDKHCIGCTSTGTDIMLTALAGTDRAEFYDLFLTTEQAEDLIVQLKETLERNAK